MVMARLEHLASKYAQQMKEVNKIDFLEQPKSKKHVDIQKGIFRRVRKFWKNYQENHKDLINFRGKFRMFL